MVPQTDSLSVALACNVVCMAGALWCTSWLSCTCCPGPTHKAYGSHGRRPSETMKDAEVAQPEQGRNYCPQKPNRAKYTPRDVKMKMEEKASKTVWKVGCRAE